MVAASAAIDPAPESREACTQEPTPGATRSRWLCASIRSLRSIIIAEQGPSNRLATTLGVGARDSPQVARVVIDTLFAFLAHQASLPRGAHDVLDVLYQQSYRLGISAPEQCKKKLLDQKGGGQNWKACQGPARSEG